MGELQDSIDLPGGVYSALEGAGAEEAGTGTGRVWTGTASVEQGVVLVSRVVSVTTDKVATGTLTEAVLPGQDG